MGAANRTQRRGTLHGGVLGANAVSLIGAANPTPPSKEGVSWVGGGRRLDARF